jgi:hypothetical protein
MQTASFFSQSMAQIFAAKVSGSVRKINLFPGCTDWVVYYK